MANRAQQPPNANPDAAAAALGRMALGDRQPASAPAVPRLAPGRPGGGGLKRNKPGFKLSDITGEDASSAANAGLGAGAPSLAREWQPRKPVTGTPFANFRKIVCVFSQFISSIFLLLFGSALPRAVAMSAKHGSSPVLGQRRAAAICACQPSKHARAPRWRCCQPSAIAGCADLAFELSHLAACAR